MKRDCPTIQELLAFDAVARHTSFTLAAASLCVTISAVSKQIASLESFIGVELLERIGRGVQLTAAGRTYWLKIAGHLRAIETATYETRAGAYSNAVLTVSCVPTFFTRWLIPRLPRFRQQYPQITLSFSRHLAPQESMPSNVDAAIRYNPPESAGVITDYLAGREFVVISSPATGVAAQQSPMPADVLTQTLLHHEEATAAWAQWAAPYGLADHLLLAGPRFAQYSALIRAARCGLGLALVPRVLVEDELADGSLVALFGETQISVHSHYLCYRADRIHLPAFLALKEWLLREGAACGSGAKPTVA